MKNKKSLKSGEDRQQNIFITKEREALKERFIELHVLYALRKNLKKAVALAQKKNYILYSSTTIYALKGLKFAELT